METKAEKTPEQIQHESNKIVRQALAHAHYLLNYQCKYMAEQFAEVAATIDVLKALCEDLQKKIEQVEPPVKAEANEMQAPYVMDVPVNLEVVK